MRTIQVLFTKKKKTIQVLTERWELFKATFKGGRKKACDIPRSVL